MENNSLQPSPISEDILSSEALLKHWQLHRGLTRRVIEAFPEYQLFNYSIGGMRTFAGLAKEIMGVSATGVRGIVTNDWSFEPELNYNGSDATPTTKADLLALWDKVTDEINNWWPHITPGRFGEMVKAFGQFDGTAISMLLYFIDNEIHHRGQGYVYLRSLGIEPPPFWDRH